MRAVWTITIMLAFPSIAFSQIVNTATMDSSSYVVTGKVTVEGYVDTYYAYNFNERDTKDIPYFVSMSRHNEFNVNLAFVDVKYSSHSLRARIVPGFGTYVNANYANEPASLKNLIEANVGIRIFKDKGFWIDAGVLGSPYTNESAISKDHLAYTRSLAAENVPYYLSGVKATLPLSSKFNAYLFLLNGWQQIADQNSNKSFGSQIELRPNNNLLITWNTYIGKERAAIDSVNGTRYFSDLYFIYKKAKLSMTGCVYYGIQEHMDENLKWMQANIITRYRLSSVVSTTLRFEYFNDSKGVLIVPVVPAAEFKTSGASLGIDFLIEDNVLLRTEARQLFSSNNIYLDRGRPATSSFTLTASLCAWF
ncbi:MAG TPA: outer membrane beta-barrel protein [Chryseosolibacter sp.]